jgi:hypothetical protein
VWLVGWYGARGGGLVEDGCGVSGMGMWDRKERGRRGTSRRNPSHPPDSGSAQQSL